MPSAVSYLVLVGCFLVISLLVRFIIAQDTRRTD
jgi:hypothetical protein